MKKYCVFLFMAAMMALAACEGPAGRDGYDGRDGRDGIDGKDGEGMNWSILTYTVRAEDWELVGGADQLNSHYIYEFSEPKLTNYIYSEGVVSGYRELTLDNGSKVLTPLPYIIPVGEEDGNSKNLWSEYYTFDYQAGSIAFYAYYTDFYTANKPPTCTFRIVMNW